MAYCEQCGAYIPDGQTKCLACGYDESEKPKGNTAAAYAEKKDYSGSAAFDSEKLRRQLEEQREKQKENSRRWAEAERARREQQERSAAAARSMPHNETDYAPGKRSTGVYETNETSRWMGMLSYIWGLWLLPMIFRRDDAFAMYHAKQGLILSVVSAIASVAGSIIGLGWVVTVARLYMIFKGINTAKEGRVEPLPYIGNIVSKL